MKPFLRFIIVTSATLIYGSGYSQGWHAEIQVELNHSLYALETISNAKVTYSGVTASGSSSTRQLRFILKGTGAISGTLNLDVSGMATQPYDPSNPSSESMSATFSGSYAEHCVRGYFEKEGLTDQQRVHIWITVYPRLQLSMLKNDCSELIFTSPTCSPTYVWEMSGELSGPYKTVQGKTTQSITLTTSDLKQMGFSDPYGRKYIRVSGIAGTTSLIEPIDVWYRPPTASFTITSPNCNGSQDGSIQVNISSPNPLVINDFVLTLKGGSLNLQQVVNDGTHAVFTGLPAGQYSIRIENNSQTVAYGNCSVTYNPDPLINPSKVTIARFEVSNFNGYEIKCKGGNDGSIKAIPSGGTGSYPEFQWTDQVSTSALATNLSEKTYTVRVKDSKGCWSGDYSHALTAPEKILVSLASTGGQNGFDVSCHDKSDGKIETTIRGGVPPYTSLWTNGSTAPSLNNAAPGAYAVRITDMNGCMAEATIQLKAPEPIEFSIAEIQEIKCPGDYSGMLEVQFPRNTIGQAYYAWTSGESESLITNKPAGEYAVSVSDDQGCSATKTHTLTEPRPYSLDILPASDFNGSYIRCNGESNGALVAVVRDEGNTVASADYFTWYKNGNEMQSGTSLSTLTELSAGTYKAEITYRDFCKLDKTFVLHEPTPVVTDITTLSNYNGTPISCHGASDAIIKATASGGTGQNYVYHWNTGATGQTLYDIPSGKYIAMTRDINGCESTTEKTVTEPDPVVAQILILSDYNGMAIGCSAASDARLRGAATGGTAPFSYAWNTGHQSQDLIDMPAAQYTLTAFDQNGCTATTETIVRDPLPVKANIAQVSDYNGFGVSCHGSKDGFLLAEGFGGTGSYEYQWNGNAHSAPLFEHLASGSYSLRIVDQNGCADSVGEIIRGPAPLVLKAVDFKSVSCYGGNDGMIDLSADGGTGVYLYSGSRDAWQSEARLDTLKAGTYYAQVMDGNGCIGTTIQTLTEPTAISIQFEEIEPALCGDPRGKVSALVSGGTGGYEYEWIDSSDRVLGTGPSISGLVSGVFTLQIRDDYFCEAMQSVGISATDGPKVLVSAIQPVSCADRSDGRATLEIIEGIGPYSFLWEDGQETPEAIHLAKGIHWVQIADKNNCITVESVTIPTPDSLRLMLVEKMEPTCNGDCNGQLSVLASGGNGDYSYDWNDFIGPRKENVCAGQYTVEVTDAKGCFLKKTYVLNQPDPLTAKLVMTRQPACRDGCDGQLAIETSGGAETYQYEWSTGASDPFVDDLCAGNYAVTVTDARGCMITDAFTLENPPGTQLDLGGDSVTLCEGQTYMLDAGPNWQQYAWGNNTGFKSSDRRVIISEAGLYWVVAMTNKGCVAQDTFLLMTSKDLMDANFLMASEAVAGDTVVLIDISWPLPENIVWNFPDEMNQLKDYGDIVYGKFDEGGQYEVTLSARLGECRDEVTKTIVILQEDNTSADVGRLGHQKFVKIFNLYPNPNDGMFDVEIEFIEESPVVLTLWNTLKATRIAQYEDSGYARYFKHVDVRPLSAGNYTLRLDYSKGTKYLRFIVR